MTESLLIKKARSMIASVKGKTLSIEERKDQAIALAALLLTEAQRIQTSEEKKQQALLAAMMNDPIGKVFTTQITDQCFRSKRPQRIADQLSYIIKRWGIPTYLPLAKKLSLQVFSSFGKSMAFITVPLITRMIRKEMGNVILPGEAASLSKHMNNRRKEDVRINLNRLGEAILGEQEAKRRLQIYLADLANPDVEYISVKISTIFSQINVLAWDETLKILSDRLRQLYRCAIKNRYQRPDGSSIPKFVNLDMEEYRDLHLTAALFRQVLSETEFYGYSAGIVLQSYLPDAFLLQQELTIWAMQRVASGGAPIKIRLVKGANLAMEQFESALRLWPQAPYTTKKEVDANFKRMIAYGCLKEHAQAALLGIGSHNLFDIAYALLLRAENGVEAQVCFEMLEGMADHMRRGVQQIAGDMLLYCPAATREEFQNAVAYLVRRLDENTAPENFLRQAFDLHPGSAAWNLQAGLFSNACLLSEHTGHLPRRTQNRFHQAISKAPCHRFENEPDTDWSLPQNRRWAEEILKKWKAKIHPTIPLIVGGKVISSSNGALAFGYDPSFPETPLYRYSNATEEQAELALTAAKIAEQEWAQLPLCKRLEVLEKIAVELQLHRADLIGAMVADTGKTVAEADIEVSEAIDFAKYYRMNREERNHLQDIQWTPKGTVLVAPPWNFPCSIPAGGILAALATGNCVIFKPPPESVLAGWHLAQIFWTAGISREVLQFMTCEDDPVGSYLVKDPRISAIVLTGATSTAKLFLQMRPGLDLMAETGGKNTFAITGMSDRDLAIKDLIQSAFGHSGQKCSACSLAILEGEVYDDPHFLDQLRDAAASLKVGSPWNFETKIVPLIRPPGPVLMRGLTQLEAGEKWLLEPKPDPHNPHLWSPGIKLGVAPSNFTFQNELFGPVLGIVRADSFEHALQLVNQTPYGLTAGIHSLDEREQEAWLNRIEAGNCYINRTITGAIVERQPFGGCKASNFGRGAKAGGPNYLTQFMRAEQVDLPQEIAPLADKIRFFSESVEHLPAIAAELSLWKASLGSYAFYWNEYFSKQHDPSKVLGQDNLQCYRPRSSMTLRIGHNDSLFDALRSIAAAMTCGTKLEISTDEGGIGGQLEKLSIPTSIALSRETEAEFIARVKLGTIKRIRLFQTPSKELNTALAQASCNIHLGPVLANGRLELLHYLREVSISRDYQRYGNLGARENEKRDPLPGSHE